MGIYIKGIEMPKDKAIAVVIHPDGIAYSAEMSAGVCTEYLKDCVAIPVSPQWIPVTERLPYTFEEVLVCTESYGETVAVFDGAVWLDAWTRNTYLISVTHWMPLPTPPALDTDKQP